MPTKTLSLTLAFAGLKRVEDPCQGEYAHALCLTWTLGGLPAEDFTNAGSPVVSSLWLEEL